MVERELVTEWLMFGCRGSNLYCQLSRKTGLRHGDGEAKRASKPAHVAHRHFLRVGRDSEVKTAASVLPQIVPS
jgi:hypothetical protein